ncbi:hypothetical protein X798_01925 [Onchocerca flexuosa]|uniref:Uncharacterized protein n=1 Tax=Onchocerca flexuosa TaxID=387005 RepID=A0A238C0X2_9BILA|nr:hypothetical protein X798_01925 [Onchocerca flexuosa]
MESNETLVKHPKRPMNLEPNKLSIALLVTFCSSTHSLTEKEIQKESGATVNLVYENTGGRKLVKLRVPLKIPREKREVEENKNEHKEATITNIVSDVKDDGREKLIPSFDKRNPKFCKFGLIGLRMKHLFTIYKSVEYADIYSGLLSPDRKAGRDISCALSPDQKMNFSNLNKLLQ